MWERVASGSIYRVFAFTRHMSQPVPDPSPPFPPRRLPAALWVLLAIAALIAALLGWRTWNSKVAVGDDVVDLRPEALDA